MTKPSYSAEQQAQSATFSRDVADDIATQSGIRVGDIRFLVAIDRDGKRVPLMPDDQTLQARQVQPTFSREMANHIAQKLGIGADDLRLLVVIGRRGERVSLIPADANLRVISIPQDPPEKEFPTHLKVDKNDVFVYAYLDGTEGWVFPGGGGEPRRFP